MCEAVDSLGKFVEIPLIRGDWKTQENSPIRDGVRYTYCPPEQVSSEMDRLISIYSEHVDAGVPCEVQAAWLHHRFSQIHPFQDGNGRVARAIASLVLVKDGIFPLVITRDDKPKYLDALEAADDGNLKILVSMIATLQVVQFRKATAISEAVLADDDVQNILGGLLKAADVIAAEKLAELKGVFDLAENIAINLDERLSPIVPVISTALQKVAVSANAFLIQSKKDREAERAQRDTFAAVVEDFIEKYAKPRNRRWAETDPDLQGQRQPGLGQAADRVDHSTRGDRPPREDRRRARRLYEQPHIGGYPPAVFLGRRARRARREPGAERQAGW